MKTLYTGGTFDLLHFGHFNFLRQCRNLATNVIVALNSDEFVRSFKGDLPILSYEERAAGLRHCPYVDDVIENHGGPDSRPAIDAVSPEIIAVGDDWTRKDYYSQMGFDQNWLDDRGITLVYVPYTRGVSTSEIKRRIHLRFTAPDNQ